MDSFLTTVTNFIKVHEGFKFYVYIDETGHRTIGYGHNLDASPITYSIPISIEDAIKLLESDINEVLIWIGTYIWWKELSDNRKICLIDMAFNLGEAGFKKFIHMINALAQANYTEAAKQLEDSKWATQVGQRAIDDYTLMLKG